MSEAAGCAMVVVVVVVVDDDDDDDDDGDDAVSLAPSDPTTAPHAPLATSCPLGLALEPWYYYHR